MKKLVSLLLAVCMCFSVGVMLTACNEEHTHTLTKVEAVAATCETAGSSEYYTCDCGKYFGNADGTTEIAKDSWVISATGHSFSDEWTFNDTHHWKEATCEHTTEKSEYAEHSLTNNECACGYVATTHTVEESEWNDLFVGEALNNVTFNMIRKIYQTSATEPLQTLNAFTKTTENAFYQVYDEIGVNRPNEEYLTHEDDKWYNLTKSGDVWIGKEIASSSISDYTFSGMQGVYFVNKKSAFTYDEENKCYVAENFEVDTSNVLDVVKIYVENGKLIKMEFTMSWGTITMSVQHI